MARALQFKLLMFTRKLTVLVGIALLVLMANGRTAFASGKLLWDPDEEELIVPKPVAPISPPKQEPPPALKPAGPPQKILPPPVTSFPHVPPSPAVPPPPARQDPPATIAPADGVSEGRLQQCTGPNCPRKDQQQDLRQVTGQFPKRYPFRAYRGERKPISQKCAKIVNETLEPGEYGRELLAWMNSDKYAKHFYRNNALGAACPEFNGLEIHERRSAWLWYWAVLGNQEGADTKKLGDGCNPLVRHRKSKKPGIGMFGMERLPQHRRWRGRMCWGKATDWRVQVSCAIGTMVDWTLSKGRPAISKETQYWEPNKHFHQIEANMKKFTPCFQKKGS